MGNQSRKDKVTVQPLKIPKSRIAILETKVQIEAFMHRKGIDIDMIAVADNGDMEYFTISGRREKHAGKGKAVHP